MELLEREFSRESHPVDVIEQVAHNNVWSFERAGDDAVEAQGVVSDQTRVSGVRQARDHAQAELDVRRAHV